MKLIDGDELLEILWRSDVSSREKIDEIVRNQPEIKDKNTRKYINDIIDSMPAAKVRINKLGMWVADGKTHRRCSYCKDFLASNANVLLYKYCPNCGAKMINN